MLHFRTVSQGESKAERESNQKVGKTRSVNVYRPLHYAISQKYALLHLIAFKFRESTN